MLNAREVELKAIFADRAYTDAHPHHPMSYQWAQWAEAHGVLPFAGGLADQPQWWLDDVTYFRLYREYHVDLPRERRDVHERINDLRKSTTWR